MSGLYSAVHRDKGWLLLSQQLKKSSEGLPAVFVLASQLTSDPTISSRFAAQFAIQCVALVMRSGGVWVYLIVIKKKLRQTISRQEKIGLICQEKKP